MSSVRVRFAPSPTGQLHFGGLRTALYNYLYTKSFNGKFLLRIEDTDRERTVPGAIEQIQSILKWTRLKPDEPPVIQSERVDIYRKYLNKLFGKVNHQNQPHVYRCFCTTDRLMLLRHDCKRRSQPYRYDGRCKQLTEKQQNEYLQQGLPHVIRFSLPTDKSGTQSYDDLVYGHHEHNPYATEGDFILLKSDGYPTYHLANVIDDHLMDITHVLRGHEWQTSTSKHLLLYKAFNWQSPIYGHLPLLERERGRKLSKRDKENAINPIEIDYYRQKGYYPNAILNFITLCGGGGFTDNDKIIGTNLDEMISLFNIKLFSRHAAIVDFKKLSLCQRAHFKREYDKSIESRQQIIDELRQKVLHYYPEKNSSTSIQLQNDYLEKCLNMLDIRINLLDELFTNNLYEYLWKEPEIKKDFIDNSEHFKFVIKQTLLKLNEIHFTHDDVKKFVEEYRPNKITNKQIFRIWRLVLCGCLQGPPVHEIVTFFGSNIVQKRFENALRVLDQQNENVQVKL
ncbi:unnamed protein product [Adineta steineri]|uniref:Nondiscriminating glutamyl-tRNA synthetase EARS2, mitochondrial n=1 Tax=Adineta steineri TaxID=433720 RepID=A0A818IMJ7_9BILA|nr:unnamed protein product [Adineta steineri]